MDGGVGVHGPDDDLELGEDAVGLLGVLADEAEAANALAVETELRQHSAQTRPSEKIVLPSRWFFVMLCFFLDTAKYHFYHTDRQRRKKFHENKAS